ncbi:hypothetical protein H9P43_008374 [Blastocladiella emersonii ATCC 22665]|nr:hypothetical protein H9P43_008374 [Blastocladiella emersonii ATCC 22665]
MSTRTVARRGLAAFARHASTQPAAKAAAPVTPESKGAVKWLIGSPDPESQIRRIKFAEPTAATTPQSLEFQRYWTETMEWHHTIWSANNTQYHAQLAAFEDAVVRRHDRPANDNDRAVFYKEFLDASGTKQSAYYRQWIGRLLTLCKLGARSAWSQVGKA